MAVGEQSSASMAPAPATARREPRTLGKLALGGLLAVLVGLGAYALSRSREKPNPVPSGEQPISGNGIASLPVPPLRVNRAEKEFRDVFGQLPTVMSWEGKRGRGTQQFVDAANLHALEISSETVWLVELCEMPPRDFDFAIELRQPASPGRIGVCLGKHLEEQGAKRILCDTFQLLRLHHLPAIPNVSPGRNQIERQKAYIDSPNRTPQLFAAHELGTQSIEPPWDAGKPRLEFSVRNHRLSRVAWNGEEIPELVGDIWEQQLTPADYEGPLGIYVEQATVWCSKPALKLITPGDSP
jgi:hypothetical protein